ncbi:uncharacterized protein [Ptychodera flava]|uniref:uncharacterized protein n=1 Tax=Ptychodera flava TaxID=63121 RepID=UPI00396A8026
MPPKHPGRVAAGKRLAEWNRQNKEKKRQAMEEGERCGSRPTAYNERTAMDAYLFLQENGEYSERFLGADNIISVIYEPGHWSVMCADMVAGMFYHIDSMKIRDSKQEMENWSNFLSNLGITKEWKVATVNNDFQQDSTSCGVYAVKISARNNAASVEMVHQRCSVSIVNVNFTASATV